MELIAGLKLVKTIRDAFPSRRVVRGLRQEHRLLESLDVPGVVKTYGLVEQDGWLGLLLEDFGGVSLASACRGRRLNVDTFLEVAIGVADALASVHAAGASIHSGTMASAAARSTTIFSM